MREMRKRNKILLSVFSVLFVLYLIGAATGGHSKSKATTPVKTLTATAPVPIVAPKPQAKIVLVASKSYCTPDPTDAYMYFTVVFSNRGDADGSVQATPRARYSDGHTSSDYNMYTGIKIPANRWSGGGGVFFTYLRFSYNAQDHYPLSCTVSYDTGGRFADDVPIAMKR